MPTGTEPSDSWRRRPHHCVLVLGNVYRKDVFKCVIESMSTKITIFSADGTPIRATVNLRVREASSVAIVTGGNVPATAATAAANPGPRGVPASGYSWTGPGASAAASGRRPAS